MQFKPTFPTLKRGLTVFTLLATLALPSTLALEGTVVNQNQTELIPGFTYTATTATTSGGQIQSHTLTVAPGSTAFPITVQGSGTIYAGASIEKALEQAQTSGYHVLGAINSDYFSLTTGVPTGLVIENGIYKSSPSNFSSILFNGSDTTILGATTVPILIDNHRSGQLSTVEHFNKYRTDTGGLYLFSRDYSSTTRTSTEGLMVRLVPTYDELSSDTQGNLVIGGNVLMTVTEVIDTAYAWDIGEHDYILTAAHQSGYREVLEDFQIGDQVTVAVSGDNRDLRDAQWATGGGDIMIDNGSLTTPSAWEHYSDGRQPRTAFGVKEDGSLVFYTVDGRLTTSVGLTQLELANHLLDEGCVYAVNLDGGGSTSFAVSSLSAPYTLTTPSLANTPSDGRLRNCATFLLFADPQIPSQLVLDGDVNMIMEGSYVELGRMSVRDINKTVLGLYPNDGTVDSTQDRGSLGSYIDSEGYPVYTFTPLELGTEVLELASAEYDLASSHTFQIVDELTTLSIIPAGGWGALTHETLRAGETLEVDYLSYLNGIYVHGNGDNYVWNLAPADESSPENSYGAFFNNTFQAGKEDALLTLSAGGQTAQVYIEILSMFDDVPETHWAYTAIDYLSTNDIIGGISEEEFGIGRDISRGDFVLMLYRAFHSPEVSSMSASAFTDVEATDYYATAISWVIDENIAGGIGDGSFGAKNPITREQASSIIYRAFFASGIDLPTTSLSTLSRYKDQSDISSYALLPIASLTQQQVLTDSSDRYYPKTSLTRESMALYLYNMLQFQVATQEDPTQLAIQPNEVTLGKGQSYGLIPLLEPAGAGASLTWSSSDPSAVSVDAFGVITNVFTGTGQPVVTVTARYGTLSASTIIRCVNDAVDLPSYTLPNIDDTVVEDSNTSDDTTPSTMNTGVVINAPGGLNVRSAPSSDGNITTQLKEGTVVNLHGISDDGEWYQITFQYDNTDSGILVNGQGYVMSAYVQPKTLIGTIVDAEVGLNLRSGAGTAFSSLGKLANGTQVSILQTFTDWYKVQVVLNGETTVGFVSSEYVSMT